MRPRRALGDPKGLHMTSNELAKQDSEAAGNPWRRTLRPEPDRGIAKEKIEEKYGNPSLSWQGCRKQVAKHDRAYRPPPTRCRMLPWPHLTERGKSDTLESSGKGLKRIRTLNDPRTDSQLSCCFWRYRVPSGKPRP